MPYCVYVDEIFSEYYYLIDMEKYNLLVEVGDPDPIMAECSYCGIGEESSFHILAECDHFAQLRMSIFFSDRLEISNFKELNPATIIRFLLDTKIESFKSKLFPTVYLKLVHNMSSFVTFYYIDFYVQLCPYIIM